MHSQTLWWCIACSDPIHGLKAQKRIERRKGLTSQSGSRPRISFSATMAQGLQLTQGKSHKQTVAGSTDYLHDSFDSGYSNPVYFAVTLNSINKVCILRTIWSWDFIPESRNDFISYIRKSRRNISSERSFDDIDVIKVRTDCTSYSVIELEKLICVTWVEGSLIANGQSYITGSLVQRYYVVRSLLDVVEQNWSSCDHLPTVRHADFESSSIILQFRY